MCELFAYTSSQSYDLTPFLKTFFSHSLHHPHGWGMAYKKDSNFQIVTEQLSANNSTFFKNILKDLPEQKVMLAHIRLASVGNIQLSNCHPFAQFDQNHRQWIQIHNGTIFHSPLLDSYKPYQQGSTDSERILLYTIDRINQESESNRIQIIENVLNTITKGNNKVNYIVYDGELLYVHTNMKNTLYSLFYNDGYMFSTTPLSNHDWKPVPLCTLFVYKEGQCIYQGKQHTNEYIELKQRMDHSNNYII